MTVGKFCNREVVVAKSGDTVLEVAKLMRQYHVGDVVIVDMIEGEDRNVPVGIITDRDIVVELVAEEIDLGEVAAGDAMSFELVTANENESIWQALQKMRASGVRRIPVVNNDGGLEGILCADDLLELLTDELSALARISGNQCSKEREKRST